MNDESIDVHLLMLRSFFPEKMVSNTEPLVLLLKGAFIIFFRATLLTSFDGSVGYFAMNTEPLVLLLIRAFYRDHLLLDCLTYVGLGFRVLCNVSPRMEDGEL